MPSDQKFMNSRQIKVSENAFFATFVSWNFTAMDFEYRKIAKTMEGKLNVRKMPFISGFGFKIHDRMQNFVKNVNGRHFFVFLFFPI